MGPNSSRKPVLLAVLVSLAVVASCADAVSGAPAFSDVTTTAGVGFLHHEASNQTLPFGAGVVVLDFNDDGLHDIYVPDSAGSNVLYRNNGNGTFTDVASAAGVANPLGIGNGGCAADYDNDGDQDLFLTNYGPSRLYRNSGDQTFQDFTAEAGLHSPDVSLRSTGCAWGDYDRDGLLDLAIVRHVHEFSPTMFKDGDFAEGARTLALYHNNGDGTFTNATRLVGDTGVPGTSEEGQPTDVALAAGFQPGWVDFDNDGDADLYIVNDFGAYLRPNIFWQNDGGFFDISHRSGAGVAIFGMGLAVADYDLDGFLDLYITNIGQNVLLRNDGDGLRFTDTATDAGAGIGAIGEQNRVSWGTVFFDYDNDGDEDLYVVSGYLEDEPPSNPIEQPNVLLRNNRDGTFTDVSSDSGADNPGIGRGGAYLDFDNDGCLDLFMTNLGQRARLFRNNCAADNHWLSVRTVGTSSNRDGIGARITVVAGGAAQTREVRSGSSQMSQSMRSVHFGLGEAETIDTVTIRWPRGAVQTLTDVAADRLLTVMEPQ